MGRTPCCDKSKVKRGPWSPEEDTTLKNFLHTHGTGGNWISLPHKAGLRRCGKSCRLRWLNYLRPDIKHGGFTHEEDNIILTLYRNMGSRWSVIASHLQGRTDNDVKNYFNTRLKKKLGEAEPSTTTDRWDIVPGSHSRLLPKSDANCGHENTDHPIMNNSAWGSTRLFPDSTEMNYHDQEKVGPSMQISDSNPVRKINNRIEVKVDKNGTSRSPKTSTSSNTNYYSQENSTCSNITFSLENSGYASWSGEGFLDSFEYFQEEISTRFGNVPNYPSFSAPLEKNNIIASQGLYQSAINRL